MRRRLVLTAAVVVLALAGCSSSLDKPTAAPTSLASTTAGVTTSATSAAAPSSTQPSTTAPSASSTCHLPDKGDIIAREKVPNLPVDAIELGGTDPEHCTWTFDYLKTSSPTGTGYCTEAAWASDNPGYDTSVTPAPPLKNVQVYIGDCA